MKLFTLSFLLLTISLHTFATTHYVTPSGAGAMNGTSWINAFPGSALQSTINAAISGDEVWVAAGTYYTTTGTNRNLSFSMKNDVGIYGSFAGNETAVSQRVFTNGLTSILSAEIGVTGNSDNSYHTISNANLNTTAIIDGFIISDANDDRPATLTVGLGGGIYNNGSNSTVCSPTIRNCVITNNQSEFGAGIFNNGYLGTASPVIINCVIAFNTATTGGGGLDNFGLSGNASPVITNCAFYSNTAALRAGAMYCWGGNNGNASPVVLNCSFINNNAVDGGAVVCDNLNSSTGNSGSANPDFRNCIFYYNTASGTGPQFYVLGSALFTATYSDINLPGQLSPPHIISGAGTGNMDYDPQFTNPNNGPGVDGNWMTSDDGLQFYNLSPCIDYGNNAGVPATDILSNTRIFNFTVDMGPYEFGSTPTGIANPDSNTLISNAFPNPSNGITRISFTLPEGISKGEIVLFDLSGHEVKKFGVTNSADTILINANEFSAGIYYYRLQTASQNSESKKLIVF